MLQLLWNSKLASPPCHGDRMNKTHVVIHHSLTADTSTVSWDAIRRYHMEQLGWSDIGYHLGIELVGTRYEVLMGRPLDANGAHCKEARMNIIGLGVCFIGNFDLAPPPPAMLHEGAKHLSAIMRTLSIPIDRAHVHPHTEFAPYKTCPGTQFPLDSFIALLRAS